MMNNEKIYLAGQVTEGVLLVAGALMAMFDVAAGKYVFSAGALGSIVQSFVYAMQNKTEDIGESRRMRLFFIASLFLGIGAWLMFKENNAWVVCLLIYAALTLYLSFRTKKQDEKLEQWTHKRRKKK